MGTHDVFIRYDIDVTFSFGTLSFHFEEIKPAQVHGTSTTCDVSLASGTAPRVCRLPAP